MAAAAHEEEEEDEEFEEGTADLVKLAARQHMNTDLRRSVFGIVMGANDYVQAYESISKLRLKDAQMGQFLRVVLHCCGQEHTFNPYYAALFDQLCAHE